MALLRWGNAVLRWGRSGLSWGPPDAPEVTITTAPATVDGGDVVDLVATTPDDNITVEWDADGGRLRS